MAAPGNSPVRALFQTMTAAPDNIPQTNVEISVPNGPKSITDER